MRSIRSAWRFRCKPIAYARRAAVPKRFQQWFIRDSDNSQRHCRSRAWMLSRRIAPFSLDNSWCAARKYRTLIKVSSHSRGRLMSVYKRSIPHISVIRCWPLAHVRLGKSKYHEQDSFPDGRILSIMHLSLGLIQLLKPHLYGLLVKKSVDRHRKVEIPLDKARRLASGQHHIQCRIKIRRLIL